MKEIQFHGLEQALKFIQGTGCIYAVHTPDGELLSNGLEVKPPKKKKKFAYPRGEIKAFVMPQLTPFIEPGQTAELKPGKFGCNRVRNSAHKILQREWGDGAFDLTIKGEFVQLIRFF
jgi:hypothetical protein